MSCIRFIPQKKKMWNECDSHSHHIWSHNDHIMNTSVNQMWFTFVSHCFQRAHSTTLWRLFKIFLHICELQTSDYPDVLKTTKIIYAYRRMWQSHLANSPKKGEFGHFQQSHSPIRINIFCGFLAHPDSPQSEVHRCAKIFQKVTIVSSNVRFEKDVNHICETNVKQMWNECKTNVKRMWISFLHILCFWF